MASVNSTVIARVAAGLYDLQLGNASMTWALNAVDSVTYGGDLGALVQQLYNTDFKAAGNAALAANIVKNVGITGDTAVVTYVTNVLNANAGHEGAAIVAMLNGLSGITTGTYAAAAAAFNTQVAAANAYSQGLGTVDAPIHPASLIAATTFNLTAGTAAGADVMRLTGGQDVRIDFTNSGNQITGLDLNGDGIIKADGKENRIVGKAANFEIVDAYARNPFDHTDIANNFLGDIAYDGTGFQGDGKTTNGNIFLGGLGSDTALGGIGNDFLAGGGIAQGHGGVDSLSGGRNADFFFAELSLLSQTDGNAVVIDGGTTSDNSSAGVTQTSQDNDWLLLEASDDDEPVTVVLRDDSILDPTFSTPALPSGGVGTGVGVVTSEGGVVGIDRTGYVITRAGVAVGTLRDIENFDASGNLYGFLNNVNVQIGGRSVDDRDVAGSSNYGLGSSAQLRVVGSNVDNVIIGGYDNDYLQGMSGNDLIFGGNMRQLVETVTGGVTNPNLSLIANDGRDELYGGAGNDNIVFEADGGVIDGDGTGAGVTDAAPAGGVNDTLWLTKYSLGTGALTSIVPDGTLRFDLTAQVSAVEGVANEGAAGYGGADTNATGGTLTIDQTKYASVAAPGFSPRVILTNIEHIDATGLGAIDFFSAGANRPELVFSNHQNFDGYNGNLTLRGTNGPGIVEVGGGSGARANNNLYAGNGDDIIEGRGNNFPVSGVDAVTQKDDLEGNGGKDDFYFAIDGDFAVGGASGGGLGGQATLTFPGGTPTLTFAGLGASPGDGFDVIRRKIDANGDGFWDQNPVAPGTNQNPSNGAFVWGQDFGLDSDATTGNSVLTIRITDSTKPGAELGSVVNAVTAVVTAVQKADGTFDTVSLSNSAISGARTYQDLATALNNALKANTTYGSDLSAVLLNDKVTIEIRDAKGRNLGDDFSEGGSGVAIQQIANSQTQNVFQFGPPLINVIQDRLIYKAYEDRSDNEGVDDDVILGSTVSLGLDAYAQDLVVSFQKDNSTTFGTGTTTFIAEDQNWEINFDNLTTQDRVTIAVNSVQYTLQVGVQLDGTIVSNEDSSAAWRNPGAPGTGPELLTLVPAAPGVPAVFATIQQTIQHNFLNRLIGYINSFSDDDTVAGSVAAAAFTAGATPLVTIIGLLQRTYNGEQTVYMRAPVVTIDNLSGGQSPNSPVWDNPATASVEGTGIVNASQHEVQLYQFDGQNNKLNTGNVKFWGQEEVQRSILETAKTAGGVLKGMDALIVDGESNTIKAAGDLQSKVSNATQLIDVTQDAVLDRLVTTNTALTYNFAVHGDDLLLSGAGQDQVWGGTGDDRIIGSAGSPVAPVVGATAGEVYDGGKNYYAVKLLDEDQARVYVLNRWEALASNITTVVPELAGKVITTITAIGQAETGTEAAPGVLKIAASGNPLDGTFRPAGTFSDTLQFQQEDFGASARFTITLDDFTTSADGSVQTPRDGAGLVSIDANGDKVFESFARFSNFENVRTVSGTGAANALTPGVANSGGQGVDTLDVSALSTATHGISYDLTNAATAGNVNYSVDAHALGGPAAGASAATLARALLRPQEGDFETTLLKVDGVENVVTGTGDDLVVIDETEAAKNNEFTAGLGNDRIIYRNNWTTGVLSPAAEPVVTITVNASPDVDTVSMTQGRLGGVIATDTLSSVEFITLDIPASGGFTGTGLQERDVLDVSHLSTGAIVDYNDLLQSSTANGTGIENSGTVRDSGGALQVTIENLYQIENVIGSAGKDTVKVADAAVMGLNGQEGDTTGDFADPFRVLPVGARMSPITFASWVDFDLISTATATLDQRIAFAKQTVGVGAINIENVNNNGEFTFDLGGGSGDTVDYSNALDNISAVVELDETKTTQYVLVDSDGLGFYSGLGDLAEVGDRIDVLKNVERIVAAQDPFESVLDLTSSTKGLEIKFSAFDIAGRVPKTTTLDAYDVYTVRISDLTSASPLSRGFVEYRPVVQLDPTLDDPTLDDKPAATWDRIEGSDNAEVIVLNAAHSLDLDTFNLRGGANWVKYNELTRSINLSIGLNDVIGTGINDGIRGVVTFSDGSGNPLPGGQSHLITSYAAGNKVAAGSLRIAATQDKEDTLSFDFGATPAKLFILGKVEAGDDLITVNLAGQADSIILTGFERLEDDPLTNDIYRIEDLIRTSLNLDLVDTASGDHDGISVDDVAAAAAFNGGVPGETTISLAALQLVFDPDGVGPLLPFDFDVLDITRTTKTTITTINGTVGPALDGGGDDELVLGAIRNITNVNDFESVVLSDGTITDAGPNYVLNTQTNVLTAGAKTITFNNNVNALSAGGTVLPGAFFPDTGVAKVASAVNISVAGTSLEATILRGGNGNDTISGAGGADNIRGGAGDDTLTGGFQAELTEVHTYTLSNPTGGAAETLTIDGVTITEGATIHGIVVANNDADAIGAAFERVWKFGPDVAAGTGDFGHRAILKTSPPGVSYDALTNSLAFNFTSAAGDVAAGIIGAAAGTAAASASPETTSTAYTPRVESADTFVFEASAADNGKDTINNFDLSDTLDFRNFFNAHVGGFDGTFVLQDLSIGQNYSGLGDEITVIGFHRGTLTVDNFGSAAAGKIQLANNAVAVFVTTADLDGAADGTAEGFKVYFVRDTDAGAGITYAVDLVGTINSDAELPAFLLTLP